MSLRRLALCLASASCLALVPLPAHAEVVRIPDLARDVVALPADGDGAATPVPDRAEGDIVAMRVVHGQRNLRVSMRLAQLTRDSQGQVMHAFAFRTGRIKRIELDLYVSHGDWQGDPIWISNDGAGTCRGVRTRIDYGADTVRAVVPRRCLGDPRWVRVGGGVGHLSGTELFADDAHLDGHVKDNLAWGPRVRRG